MPLMEFEGFIGPTYTAQSAAFDSERCVNLYPERIAQEATGKSRIAYFGTPGTTLYANIGANTVIYAMLAASNPAQQNYSYRWVLAGAPGAIPHLYSISNTGAVTDRGVLPTAAAPTSALVYYQMLWNGVSLLIIGMVAPGFPGTTSTLSSNTWMWSYNPGAGSFAQVAIPVSQFCPAGVALLDGYAVAIGGPQTSTQVACNTLATSNYLDAATWNALAYATVDQDPDLLVGVATDHGQLFVFGRQRTLIYYDAGTYPFPLARYPGAVMEVGASSQFAIAQLDNGLFWVGADPRGKLAAYRNNGYTPERISTRAIETIWQQYTTTSDIVSYGMQINGHPWWVVNFQSAHATWVYDVASQQWFEWLHWNGTSYVASLALYHMFDPFTNQHFVAGGDNNSGNIYLLSTTTYTDNGTAIQRLRRTPHLSKLGKRMFYHSFELALAQGAGDSSIALTWSNDAGNTFPSSRTLSGGAAGSYTARARAVGLGSARDRVFQATTTDAAPICWIAAYIDVDEGMY